MLTEDDRAAYDAAGEWFAARGFGLRGERKRGVYSCNLTSIITGKLFEKGYATGDTLQGAIAAAKHRYEQEHKH